MGAPLHLEMKSLWTGTKPLIGRVAIGQEEPYKGHGYIEGTQSSTEPTSREKRKRP